MTWIIGDIHGCLRELNELLKALPADDPLVFLGDYIDRGPDSAGVIERILEERGRSTFLMGNHESMMMAHFHSPGTVEALSWLYSPNGGLETMRSYGLTRGASFSDVPKTHRQFLEALPLYHEAENFIAVHAGVRTGVGSDMSVQTRHDLLWIRTEWIKQESAWTGKFVYYGHTPSRYVFGMNQEHALIKGERSLGIDTGCVYGGSLTAVNAENNEVVQVRAGRPYW
ncbi:MAG: metallophosphoesterase [Spirochaetia bacterium]|nr:metallophosphoesterase [Spirochaetia bacterium]